MFPLKLILLPGEEMPLRIFEPRYQQLLDESERLGTPFAIPYTRGHTITPVGSRVELVRVVSRHANGNSVVLVRGTELLRVLGYTEELPGKRYGGGEVVPLPNAYWSAHSELNVLVKKFGLRVDPHRMPPLAAGGVDLLEVAKALMLTSEEKYRLLSSRSDTHREQLLLGQLRLLVRVQEQERALENNFQLN